MIEATRGAKAAVIEQEVAGRLVRCISFDTATPIPPRPVRHAIELSMLRRLLDGAADDLRLTHEHRGRPVLWLDRSRIPAVSFAFSPGQAWAAFCPSGIPCGIDSASACEFPNEYPHRRAFGDNEVGTFTPLLPNAPGPDLHALAWSLKEAAVKALGCAFHRFGPLCVQATGITRDRNFVRSDVLVRPAHRCLPALSFLSRGTWVSFALDAAAAADRGPDAHATQQTTPRNDDAS